MLGPLSQLSPPRTFTLVSLLIITVMVVATGLGQSAFYRQAIIDRESVIISDLVGAIVLGQQAEGRLSAADLADPTRGRVGFEHGLEALRKLSGIVRIKVFNAAKTIVWSDEPGLIGKQLTRHREELSRAMAGKVQAVFLSDADTLDPNDPLPTSPLIEFYVPFSIGSADAGTAPARGVMAIYRSPTQLIATIRSGLLILWSASFVTGLVLFLAVYRLFQAVYFRQREAESQLTRLSMDQKRLVQIEKLSGMGQIVSEIAHQLNNPLVGVTNLAELAERDPGNPPRTRELLREIRSAGNHCRDFVHRMLRFNQVSRSEPHPTEVKALVQETITFVTQTVDGHPKIDFVAPHGDVVLEVDPVLLRHALFNLIHNATLAGPGKPVVVTLSPEAGKGVPGWRLAVADNGPGIPPAVAARLFTPFFTTRPGGTGLGLTVAQHIVLQHNGQIHAETRPDGGALFVIWLPTTRQANEAEHPGR